MALLKEPQRLISKSLTGGQEVVSSAVPGIAIPVLSSWTTSSFLSWTSENWSQVPHQIPHHHAGTMAHPTTHRIQHDQMPWDPGSRGQQGYASLAHDATEMGWWETGSQAPCYPRRPSNDVDHSWSKPMLLLSLSSNDIFTDALDSPRASRTCPTSHTHTWGPLTAPNMANTQLSMAPHMLTQTSMWMTSRHLLISLWGRHGPVSHLRSIVKPMQFQRYQISPCITSIAPWDPPLTNTFQVFQPLDEQLTAISGDLLIPSQT